MNRVIGRIHQEIEPIYKNSFFYTSTIYQHVSRVAQKSKELALEAEGNEAIAESGGWLHDLGAVLHGRDNHHITGVKEASPILLVCGCPREIMGHILECIYYHRGSQKMPIPTIEAKCVAAADALDHFYNVEELWRVQVEDRGIMEMQVYQTLLGKFERDWQKIAPEIKVFLNGEYDQAQEALLKLASQRGVLRKRKK